MVEQGLHVLVAAHVDAAGGGVVVDVGREENHDVEELLARTLHRESEGVERVVVVHLKDADNLHAGFPLEELFGSGEGSNVLHENHVAVGATREHAVVDVYLQGHGIDRRGVEAAVGGEAHAHGSRGERAFGEGHLSAVGKRHPVGREGGHFGGVAGVGAFEHFGVVGEGGGNVARGSLRRAEVEVEREAFAELHISDIRAAVAVRYVDHISVRALNHARVGASEIYLALVA